MHCSRIMAPNHHFMLNPLEPVSRTYQYRKVMKPMLERRRRARINKCLDELKDLMTGTLQADGENVSKLEKADILELTVRHLQRLREHNALFLRTNETLNMEKFWAGFQHCAVEVSQFLSKYDQNISGDLVKHMASYIPNVPIATATVTSSTVSHTHTYINNCTDSNSSNTSLSSNSSSRKATLVPHQRLAVSEIPQQQTSSRHVHESKSISKSTISAARFNLHPYARATTAAASGAVVIAGSGLKSDPIGGDDDANVWRPW